MKQNLLGYFSEINESYIHPKGEEATDFIFKALAPEKNEFILEFGCGTGTSLTRLISSHPTLNLFGVDINADMIDKSAERLQYCGLKNKVTLTLVEKNTSLPFDSNFFDKIYVESVLAIQEDENLGDLISELGRVLKPTGKLYMNELIWAPAATQSEIDEINNFVKEKFGLIQANGKYPYLKDWLSLLVEKNFKIEEHHNIGHLKNKRFRISKNYREFRSRFFTLKGKLKSKISPKLRAEWKSYKNDMGTLNMKNKVEFYIICAQNNK